MKLSLIIPVHNGGNTFRSALQALVASTRRPDETIIVDDGSTDDSAAIAREHGATQVIALSGPPRGPAFARNRGVEAAQGDILVFLDADVAVHPETLARIEAQFAANPDIDALFGSYDDVPAARGVVTLYKNLLHHYVHQHGQREASTFWAGCGAVRRHIFNAVGGYDEGYTRPSIEDIELGHRLKRAGHRIALCPEVQVTHYKRWTLLSLLRTDIFCRAVPWTRLILQSHALPNDLNLNNRSRVSAAAAWGCVLFLLLGAWFPGAWLGLVAALGVLAAANAELFRFLRRKGGIGFLLGAFGLHLLYLLYSSLIFAVMAGPSLLARHGLALLLLATLFKGLTWSVMYPPWHAPDEPQHFLYGQNVERQGTLLVRPTTWLPEEAVRFAACVQFERARRATLLPLNLADEKTIAAAFATLNDPRIKRHVVVDQHPHILVVANFNHFHPPGYYALLGAFQWLFEGDSIALRSLVGRWLSVALSLVTVLAAYSIGRELSPERRTLALWLSTLVSFQPMLTFCSSVMTNEALEIPLFSIFLLLSLRIARDGLSGRCAFLLGLVVALGLLTKVSFLAVLPLLVLLACWDMVRLRRAQGIPVSAWGRWLLVVLLPTLLCAWWYGSATAHGGEAMLHSYGTDPLRSHIGLFAYLTHYPWISVYAHLLHAYWGDFGWFGPYLPKPLAMVIVGVCALFLGVCAWKVGRSLISRSGPKELFSALCAVYCALATLCVALFYIYISFRFQHDAGKSYVLQGRYYLPPIAGQMACLACLLVTDTRRNRVIGGIAASSMILLNFYALFGVVAPAYYGPGGMGHWLAAAALFQPLPRVILAGICGAFGLASGLLLLALISTAIVSESGAESTQSPQQNEMPQQDDSYSNLYY
jgi:4-amino-4-deoxy-L-arabinose transferase-like glycosyltransferase